MKVEKLIWDSNFFGINIGSVSVGELNESVLKFLAVNKDEFDVIYIFDNNFDQVNEYKGIKTNSFYLVDTKLTFTKLLQEISNDVYPLCSVYSSGLGVTKLYDLAYQSGEYSRFNKDTKFPQNSFKNLYKRWIDNAIDETSNSEVIVCGSSNTIYGMLTLDYKETLGQVGLFAIDYEHRGRGYGEQLLKFAEVCLKNKNIHTIDIPTQKDNIPACNFYKKNGMSIKSEVKIYHYWPKYDNTI